ALGLNHQVGDCGCIGRGGAGAEEVPKAIAVGIASEERGIHAVDSGDLRYQPDLRLTQPVARIVEEDGNRSRRAEVLGEVGDGIVHGGNALATFGAVVTRNRGCILALTLALAILVDVLDAPRRTVVHLGEDNLVLTGIDLPQLNRLVVGNGVVEGEKDVRASDGVLKGAIGIEDVDEVDSLHLAQEERLIPLEIANVPEVGNVALGDGYILVVMAPAAVVTVDALRVGHGEVGSIK